MEAAPWAGRISVSSEERGMGYVLASSWMMALPTGWVAPMTMQTKPYWFLLSYAQNFQL